MTKLSDRSVVQNAQALERKYLLEKFFKNFEFQSNEIIKLNDSIKSMISGIIINLSELLDTQTSISLYFYKGIPSKENEPFINWENPEDHLGDFYYDQTSGYVYQYTKKGWIQKNDSNLVNAMALSNSEIDTSDDHSRKVFFAVPYTPYDCGDWWIQKDGSLKICQITKGKDEDYDEQDFIDSSKYSANLATKVNNELTVLKGTVQTITDTYVKFTDLETGGSTSICGDNITTGSLKSQNYSKGVSGLKINLEDGSIDSLNFKVNDGRIEAVDGIFSGTIKASDKVLADERGVISVLEFSSIFETTNMTKILGKVKETFWESSGQTTGYVKYGLVVLAYIPDNFTVDSAKVYIHNSITSLKDMQASSTATYAPKVDNIKLKKAPITNKVIVLHSDYESPYLSSSLTDTNCLGSNGISISGSQEFNESYDLDISFLSKGLNVFCLVTDMVDPTKSQVIMPDINLEIYGYVK